MRFDLKFSSPRASEPIPLRWFTWGYELHDSRWWPYWCWRLPGRSWQVYADYARDRHEPCWCVLVLSYRGYGFQDFSVIDGHIAEHRRRHWDLTYRPLEQFL